MESRSQIGEMGLPMRERCRIPVSAFFWVWHGYILQVVRVEEWLHHVGVFQNEIES